MKEQELIKEIKELSNKISQAKEWLSFDLKEKRIAELEKISAKKDFWNDQKKAAAVSQEISDLQETLEFWKNLEKEINDLKEIADWDKQDQEVNLREDVQKSFFELKKKFQEKEFILMLSGKYDSGPAIVTIHAGTGGVDAMDWAEILLRMILRYCERKNLKVTIIDKQTNPEGGIKSATLEVFGQYSYGYLKSENGVHRLVRISPFDAEAMRHTSFALIEVTPLIEQDIDFEIDEKDFKIDVFRASGHGGQGVNTTDSAVRITHLPTGIKVVCQNERSQHQNKETAMKILKSKLQVLEDQRIAEEKEELRGDYSQAAWGNQIRSYVLHPYKMVKDHRTNFETDQVDKVLDGALDSFVEEYLKTNKKD